MGERLFPFSMVIVFLLCLGLSPDFSMAAKEVTVYAASDLQLAMRELAQSFEKENPGVQIKLIFGSSGKGYAQLRSKAPFDLFFSADMGYTERLHKDGLTLTQPKPYAQGRLVLWSLLGSRVNVSKGLEALLDPSVKKIAIANPKHAPYGRAAQEALKKAGLWDRVQEKLVIAENISQAAHYALSGAADVGLIALPLVHTGELAQKGQYSLIPQELHSPLIQGFVIMKHAQNNEEALRFAEFVGSESGRQTLSDHGFVLPTPSP